MVSGWGGWGTVGLGVDPRFGAKPWVQKSAGSAIAGPLFAPGAASRLRFPDLEQPAESVQQPVVRAALGLVAQ
jgi:hypothetical protein